MANIIKIKRGTGTSILADGELGFNTSSNTLYIGRDSKNLAIGGTGAFLPLTGGTVSGKITLSNSNSSGNISLWADNEGGNLSIQSKSGTYSYQMDGNYDSFLRLISFKGSSHTRDWYFHAESGLFDSPSIQTGGLVVSAGHNYPGTSLKKTSDNREVGYGGAIADDTTYAQIVYKGKDGYTEYYLMPAYTEGKGKDYWYDIYTNKNLRVGGRNLLKCLPLSKMPFGTGDSSGSDTKGTVSYDAYSKSLCVVNNNSNLRLWLYNDMPVKPNETYTISCWTASNKQDPTAGEPYQFQIIAKLNSGSLIHYSKDNTNFKTFSHADTSGNGWGWKIISQTFTTPNDCTKISVAFRAGYDYQNYTNRFYIKNFKIEQSPVYTDWCPAPEELLTVEGGSTYESLQIGTGKSRHLNLWAGDDGVTKIGHQDASWLETNAIYLYDTHTYFKKPLQIVNEQFWESGSNGDKYGIDMRNSDIMNANGIYFQDDANAMGEGLNFYRGTNTWDSLLASGGKLYFAPNRAKNSVGTRYEVYHSGGATIPISKGGTGATTAAGALTNLGALSKSGGTIDGTAVFTWADSGNFNQSGVSFPVRRGGLSWNGQSDGVDLFAEETASDNLDLVIQFRDDSSNGLQIRNHTGGNTCRIDANGYASFNGYIISNDSIHARNSSQQGHFRGGVDGEGGYWEVKSKSGTYTYQFDAYQDSVWRLYAWDNTTNKYAADITFDATKNRLIAHRLRLTSTADALETQTGDVALTIGPEDGQHLIIDTNEILSKTNATTTGDLYLQGLQIQHSGKIVAGTWNASAIGVGYGGTGATTAAQARKNLAVPYYAKYDAGNLQTGAGNVSAWITYYGDDGTAYNQMDLGKTATAFSKPVNVASGGTGATSASGARANLGALSNAGDTANGNYTLNGSLLIQNTSTQKIALNNTNANSESSIGFNNAGTLKWVCGIGCGGSGNTFALWNNNLSRNDITVDNTNGHTTFTGAIIAKNNSSSGYAKMWNDNEGGNIQIGSKSGNYHYQWDAHQDNHMRFFVQGESGSVLASWNYWPHSGCFTTKAININNTGDITGITYSGSAPAGSAGHIWLKPI